MNKRSIANRFRRGFFQFFNGKRGKRGFRLFTIDKRQKFVISVIFLSIGLFLAEFTKISVTNSGFFAVLFLAFITNLFLFWAIHEDIRENRAYQSFILPFFLYASIWFILFSYTNSFFIPNYYGWDLCIWFIFVIS